MGHVDAFCKGFKLSRGILSPDYCIGEPRQAVHWLTSPANTPVERGLKYKQLQCSFFFQVFV
jgi:hypothetical protein